MTISPGNSRSIAQESGEIWTAQPLLQPISFKSDRLLEREIKELSPEELAELRSWFAEFDAQAWDRQFETDVKAGKLDAVADKALRAHAAGETTKL